MKRYFHGGNKQGPYFEGWYFKCQTQTGDAIAVIPALHIESGGQESASIQVISGSGSWWVEFAASRFHAAEDRLQIEIGGNVFSGSGMSLNLKQEGFSLCGRWTSALSCPSSQILWARSASWRTWNAPMASSA